MEGDLTSRDVFEERLRGIGITNIKTFSEDADKIYVFADERGYGITSECYDGLDVQLIESIGMESLTESHRLYCCDAHHILIFKVE